MCALFFQKKIPTFSLKKRFFSRKHDFSRKFEGGTGLQGVSSNLNLNYHPTFWLLKPHCNLQQSKFVQTSHFSVLLQVSPH